eukprot:TRINITY_DN49451_c0_g1_i1.p1 TRINITY_DN49451_c0_g1~~TRINITY_DN49451_c0_g1_i1.p1  ORF type:complete len:304 (-),score=54.78 TRINITY_DN49451_c0_g1_i1:27-938(-)
MLAHDAAGQSHRANKWGTSTEMPASVDGLDMIRQHQRTWIAQHPEMLLKWSFPTKRRDAIRVTFRAMEKMEACVPAELRQTFNYLVSDCEFSVQRVLFYLYFTYLYPCRTNISAKGRHLLMVKVYESKAEAYVWFIPIDEVHAAHKQTREVMNSGISLNDVQLVETYIVESTLAVHYETFARVGGKGRAGKGNDFGECTSIGGVAFHLVLDAEDKFLEKSTDYSFMSEKDFAEMTEKSEKMREKRLRKKANQKAKKEEQAAADAAAEKLAEEKKQQEERMKREESLVKPHASLMTLLESGAPV